MILVGRIVSWNWFFIFFFVLKPRSVTMYITLVITVCLGNKWWIWGCTIDSSIAELDRLFGAFLLLFISQVDINFVIVVYLDFYIVIFPSEYIWLSNSPFIDTYPISWTSFKASIVWPSPFLVLVGNNEFGSILPYPSSSVCHHIAWNLELLDISDLRQKQMSPVHYRLP